MSIYFVFALTLLNGASVQAARVLLALYALDLGAQPLTVGILAATFSMFPVLLAVKVGKLADRLGSRWLLVCGATAGGLGMLMPYLFSGISTIFVAGVMNGLSAVLFNLLTQNLVGILSDEQSGAIRCGAGGAKGGGRGECEPAKHGPGTEPGNRVTSAGAHTASSKAKEEGEVHRAPPPHQHRTAR